MPRAPRPANPKTSKPPQRPQEAGESPPGVPDTVPPPAPDPGASRIVHVRYDGPSGVVVSSDDGETVQFKEHEVTVTTQGHMDRLRAALPDHKFTTVKAPRE